MPRTKRVFLKDYSWFDVYCVALSAGFITIIATLPLYNVKNMLIKVLPLIVLLFSMSVFGYAKLYNHRYAWE